MLFCVVIRARLRDQSHGTGKVTSPGIQQRIACQEQIVKLKYVSIRVGMGCKTSQGVHEQCPVVGTSAELVGHSRTNPI